MRVKEPKTFIIAEAGVNHNGSVATAKELIDIAADAGADAVKFQTFQAERLVGRKAPKARYQQATTDPEETQFAMIKRLELDEEAHEALMAHAEEKGIEFLSSPFDLESVAFLAHRLNIRRLKIPSGEITNGPLLLKAAATGKPLILSTGMCTLGDVEAALGVIAFGCLGGATAPSLQAFREAYASEAGRKILRKRLTLLHCTTEYPAPFGEVNLRAMGTMRAAFGLPTGYSDHTPGIAVAIAAVALGAAVIEKHFTKSRDLPGPDHRASLEPVELKQMVRGIRAVEKALGDPAKRPGAAERMNRPVAAKSLVALTAIEKGALFTPDNLGAKRPGTGISPMHYWELLGTAAGRDYEPDEAI